MSSIDNLLKIVESKAAKFISFKYFDKNGKFQQIDVAVTSLVILNDFILVNNIKLRPIDNRYFIDPFRSYSTLFCLCDNLNNLHNPRIFLKDLIANNDWHTISLELSINFLILNREEKLENYKDQEINCQNQVEPIDQLANLRAEIIGILEAISIPTVSHFHASKNSSCSIVIKAENFLDLADYLVISSFIIKNVAESYGKSVWYINELNNQLLLLFPGVNYNKELAISLISGIMHLSSGDNNSNIFVAKKPARQNVMKSYYSYDIIRNYHTVSFNLNQDYNIYLALSCLLIYGFDIKLINGKFSKEILQSYFDKND
ncbi:MAG: lengsin [Rickettsia endosymbiont of Bryobia graminum]|nr:lengsin [Rickettsia endosymbiont of Bryobia graminum]